MDPPCLRRVASAVRTLQNPFTDNDVVQVQPRSKSDGHHERSHKRQVNLQIIRGSHVYHYATHSEDRDELHHQCFALSAFSASAMKFLML